LILDLKGKILPIVLAQLRRLACSVPDEPKAIGITMGHFVGANDRGASNRTFETAVDDLRSPVIWSARLRCAICGQLHDFKFAGARLSECPHKCGHYRNCQLCISD